MRPEQSSQSGTFVLCRSSPLPSRLCAASWLVGKILKRFTPADPLEIDLDLIEILAAVLHDDKESSAAS